VDIEAEEAQEEMMVVGDPVEGETMTFSAENTHFDSLHTTAVYDPMS